MNENPPSCTECMKLSCILGLFGLVVGLPVDPSPIGALIGFAAGVGGGCVATTARGCYSGPSQRAAVLVSAAPPSAIFATQPNADAADASAISLSNLSPG